MRNRSVKFNMAAASVLLVLVILALLSYLLYQDIKRIAFEREVESESHNLYSAMTNIERTYLQVQQYIMWMPNSAEITKFLSSSEQNDSQDDYHKVLASYAVHRQLFTMSLSDTIEKLLISRGDSGYITAGSSQGNTNDWEKAQPFLLRNGGSYMNHVIDSPFDYGLASQMLVYSDELRSYTDNRVIGWVDVFFSPKLFTDRLGENTYIAISGVLYEAGPNTFTEIPCDAEILAPKEFRSLENGIKLCSGRIGSYDGPYLLMQSTVSGRAYIKPLGHSGASLGLSSFSGMFIVGSIFLVFAVFLAAMLYTMFRYERQREAKNYEFKVLQSQINPHFLYNTLNSIKWMATLQKADGIAEMTATLATLLRRIARISDEVIPISEELRFIEDYILIQRYRYGDMFTVTVNVAEERLKQAKIIKFTLQPIIENAIFHGLEPKQRAGAISLDISEDNGDLVVLAFDDGVGIEAEALERINRMDGDSSKDSGNIGLSNIHRRIQLEYGSRYGLRLESEAGAYTRCIVRIPLIL